MRFNIVHNYIFIIIDDINNYIHKSKPLVFLYVHRAIRATFDLENLFSTQILLLLLLLLLNRRNNIQMSRQVNRVKFGNGILYSVSIYFYNNHQY